MSPYFVGPDHYSEALHSEIWVFSMNITKGLAPTARDVALKWDDLAEREVVVGDHTSECERGDLSKRRNRAFFSSWRKNWVSRSAR